MDRSASHALEHPVVAAVNKYDHFARTAAVEIDERLEDLLTVGVVDDSLQLVQEERDRLANLAGESSRQRQDLSGG